MGGTAHRCSDQEWEVNNTFSKQTQRSEVELAGDIVLRTVTQFSQRAWTGCLPNMLNSWVLPHTNKATTNVTILVLMVQQDKKGANTFWASRLTEFNAAHEISAPWGQGRPSLCSPCASDLTFLVPVALCCSHLCLCQSRDHEPLKDKYFLKHGVWRWMNERSLYKMHTPFLPLDGKYSLDNLNCLRHSLVKTS